MDPRAIGLALGAACIHAGWNLRLHRDDDRAASITVAMLIGGLLLLPALVLAFPAQALGLAVLSALAETVYALALAAAYSRGRMSVAYPIGRGLAPVLITAAGVIVLGQRPGPVVAAGALLLLAGLTLVAGGGERHERGAMAFACLTGISIAAYSVIDARAVRSVNALGYLSAVMLLSGALLVLGLRGDVRRLRAAARTGAQIGAGSVAAYALVLIAFQLAPAGRVATLRESSVLIGVLAAREGTPRRILAGATLVVAGVLCAGT